MLYNFSHLNFFFFLIRGFLSRIISLWNIERILELDLIKEQGEQMNKNLFI